LSALARAGFIVGPNPDGSDEKVFACSKMNVAVKPKSLRFKIVSATVQSSEGEDIATSKIEWLGESPYTADDLCKPDAAPADSAIDEAVDFLKQVLADGGLPASEVKTEAKDAGISFSTLQRAKAQLGVKSKKGPSSWYWHLPKPKG